MQALVSGAMFLVPFFILSSSFFVVQPACCSRQAMAAIALACSGESVDIF
jgi:hypothetical protein